MKKTLIALLALSSLSMGAVEIGTAFTLDSKVVNDSLVSSAFDAYNGIAGAQAATNTGLTSGYVGYQSCQANVKVNELLSNVELSSDQVYTVTKIQFIFRDNNQSNYLPASGTLTYSPVAGETYTANYTGVDYTPGKCGVMTFEFDEDNQFILTGKEEDILIKMAMSSTAGYEVASNNGTVTLEGVAPFTGAWKPIIRISGIVAPEPATATLSLLALAGLASRRRRH